MAVLGLRFCARAFSSCGKRGHSSSRCAGLSLLRPLLLRSTGSRRAGSAIVAHGPSRSAACGIFPDQGSNPRPLHWQADSQPLRHQGSPFGSFLYLLFFSWDMLTEAFLWWLMQNLCWIIISVMSVLIPIDYFSFSLRFFWFLIWVIVNWNLGIFGIMLWESCSYLNLF